MEKKIVPLFRVIDMTKALAFYTEVLDFKVKYPEDLEEGWVVDIADGDAEIQLTRAEGNPRGDYAVNVWVENVDALFQHYLSRGLDISNKKESTVHQGPIDQSWGFREFYVTDADGNTLRFRQYPNG